MLSTATTVTPDVLVVGGGAIGAAAAYELARRGARVTVSSAARDARGCSYGNAGLICPSHAEALASPAAIRDGLRWMGRRDSPFRLRPRLALVPWLARFGAAALPSRSHAATRRLRALAERSLALHAALARASLPTSFARRGILSVYERGGVPGMLSAGARRAQLEPRALAPPIAGAVLHPDEAHCDPGAFVDALLAGARELRRRDPHRGRDPAAAAHQRLDLRARHHRRPAARGHRRARRRHVDAGARRARSACTSRSRPRRATTSRPTATAARRASRSTWRKRG